jgi:UDP-N-acetylmuramoyl-L-alanyl-D-glutamate--2,6-diaminopimelate ligase
MLREMVIQGCQSAVMEVTSHALDQGRVENIDFDVAIFTNLTLDHLNYHYTMESYAAAKNKLFASLDSSRKKLQHSFPKTAIVNIDNPWYSTMLQGCRADVLTYGLSANADLMAKDVVLSPSGTMLTLSHQGKLVKLKWPLVGKFNAYNCLAAVAVGLVRGIPLKDVAEIMSIAPGVPGRLEAVSNALGLKIYVDFAHTDDALANVLECLQEFKTGRIIVVFGCGGDRDISKRPKMAQVCERLADVVIVTSDNPRSENPDEITRQIATGFARKDNNYIEVDRSKAIEKAIDMATSDDIILIAGKGHETYQIFAHKTIEFDDRKVAAEICRKKAAQVLLNHN